MARSGATGTSERPPSQQVLAVPRAGLTEPGAFMRGVGAALAGASQPQDASHVGAPGLLWAPSVACFVMTLCAAIPACGVRVSV